MSFHLPMNNPAIDLMAGLPQWVLHRNKQPYNPHTGRPASSTDSKTWGTFDECANEGIQRNYGGPYDGVGFVFTLDTGIIGIDMDKCIKNDKPEPWAKTLIKDLDSYTEKSPSGNGYHIYIKGGLTRPPKSSPNVKLIKTIW
jgi:putative DNA primase/helicase